MVKHLLIVGHGLQPDGTIDPGALSQTRIAETDLNEELAFMIQDWSRKAGSEIDVHSEYDVYGYKNFGSVALNYDTVTEIHFNAYNRLAHGTEILIYEEYEPDEMDKRLLEVLAKDFFNRGFKKRPYSGKDRIEHISKAHDLKINYRLVEVCFIDNENDMRIYQARKKEIARGLAEAILNKRIPHEPERVDKKLYRVQVGAFTNFKNAELLVKDLERKGFKGAIIK